MLTACVVASHCPMSIVVFSDDVKKNLATSQCKQSRFRNRSGQMVDHCARSRRAGPKEGDSKTLTCQLKGKMILNVFAFLCTVVEHEFGNHSKLVKINPQVLINVVFLYYCASRCTSFTRLGTSSTTALDAGGFAH